LELFADLSTLADFSLEIELLVFNENARRFPDSSSGFVVEKKVQRFLLLSKRSDAIIPVGNLKVDSP